MDPQAGWALHLPTALNCTFDVLCASLGTYILLTRTRSRTSGKHTTTVAAQVTPSPIIPLTTPSLWTRKRLPIILATTLATSLTHLTRLLLIFSLSLDAHRIVSAERAKAARILNGTEVPTNEEEIIPQGNPLMRPPALYGVLAIPVLLFLSRALLVLLFALPTSRRLVGVNSSTVPASPITPVSQVPASPGLRPRKMSTAKPTSPSSPSFPSNTHHTPAHVAPSPLWSFISSLPKRLHGPTQNLYLLAFYTCIGLAIVFVPFSYHTYWYFDVPRPELVLSLYLAAVLQDAKNVPGLTTKEKRARGIYVLERVVWTRWVGLALLLLEIPIEASWRFLLDGSVLFILWRADV